MKTFYFLHIFVLIFFSFLLALTHFFSYILFILSLVLYVLKPITGRVMIKVCFLPLAPLHPSVCRDRMTIRGCWLMNDTSTPVCFDDDLGFKYCRKFCDLCSPDDWDLHGKQVDSLLLHFPENIVPSQTTMNGIENVKCNFCLELILD